MEPTNPASNGSSLDQLTRAVDPQAAPKLAKKRKSRKGLFAIIIILVVVVAAVAAGFATGRLYVGLKTPSQKITVSEKSQKVTVTTVVCGDDVINQFNQAYANFTNEAAFQNLINKIKSLSGYSDDASCQQMLFIYSVYKNDSAGEKAAGAVLTKLHNEGIFPNNNISGLLTISSVQLLIGGGDTNDEK